MSKQPLVNAETSIGEKKTRAVKNKLGYDKIRELAIALPLHERASLSNDLKTSVNTEIDNMAAVAAQVKGIIGNI